MNEKKNDNMVEEELLGIKEIVEKYSLSPVYVRRMVQKGKLIPDKKVSINNSTTQFKYLFKLSTVERWRKNSGGRAGIRSDGRRKYNLYMTSQEQQLFDEFLKKNEKFNGVVQLSNPGKSK